jgi:hypothetical protein
MGGMRFGGMIPKNENNAHGRYLDGVDLVPGARLNYHFLNAPSPEVRGGMLRDRKRWCERDASGYSERSERNRFTFRYAYW